jgi:biotin carboxyl carrier protein
MSGTGFVHGNVPVGGEETESVVNDQTTTRGGSGSAGLAVERQLIVNTDYGYRMPYYESQAQNERAQISLIDQQFSQYMYSQQLPNLTTIFQNELRSIDGDVYRLQIAFLSSILLAPFAGTVTGVYKYPGDSVRAGEPVLRVENNETVLIVATVVYRDRVALGATATIQTNLYDSATTPTTVAGTVVAARGHAPDDDHWDIVIKCNNVSGGAQVLPIEYSFDYDDTVVTIT